MFDNGATHFRSTMPLPVRSTVRCARFAATLLATGLAIGACAQESGTPTALTKSDVFFELNDTDGDLGIHARIDGDGWRGMRVWDPNGKRIVNVVVEGRLARQGLTELFTESAEPSFDELPPKTFFARFPEGTYRIEGIKLDGGALGGTARLTHVMPAPPANLRFSGTAAPKDCGEGPVPRVGKPVMVTWDPVTRSHPDLGKKAAVKVVKYELVVVREKPVSLGLSVDFPPDATRFEIPKDFIALDSGGGFKFEIVVKEASGNQTVLETCFKLE